MKNHPRPTASLEPEREPEPTRYAIRDTRTRYANPIPERQPEPEPDTRTRYAIREPELEPDTRTRYLNPIPEPDTRTSSARELFGGRSDQGHEHCSQRIVVAFVSEQHFTSLPHAAMHWALGRVVWPFVKPHASAESTVTLEKQLPTSPGFGWQAEEAGVVVVEASEPASGVVSVPVLLPQARSPKKKRRSGRPRVIEAQDTWARRASRR